MVAVSFFNKSSQLSINFSVFVEIFSSGQANNIAGSLITTEVKTAMKNPLDHAFSDTAKKLLVSEPFSLMD